MSYLFAAYVIAFCLIGGFVLYLIGQLRSVRSEIEDLKRRHRD
ncbi:MAG: CcmD family protein [Candidatus Dormibacteraceae bacterium]